MIVPECAATIGVFDGVHAGHRQVIKQMMDEAQQHGYKSMVITFDKLPQQLFVPGFQAQLITTLDEKIQLLGELGINYLVVLPFDMQIAQLTAREFMAQILHERLNVKALCIGYDNQFGRGRMETFDDYVEYGKALGMRVLGLTLAANYAGEPGISHQSVLAAARDRAEEFESLVCGILAKL